MPIEEVISVWRNLNAKDKYEAVRQLEGLVEANEIESQLNNENELLTEDFEKDEGSSQNRTRHVVINGDFNSEETFQKLDKLTKPTLIFTSPPYNAGINYGLAFNDKKPLEFYIEFLRDFMKQSDRILPDGGRFVINLRDISKGPGQRLPAILPLYNCLCNDLGYSYRGLHIWYKGREESSFAWGVYKKSTNPAIIDLFEYVFVFQKGTYPDGEDDLEKTEFIENVLGIWKIRPVKKITGKDKKNTMNHPCPFPVELPKRVIRLYSHVGSTVLDPFAGVLNTACGAAETGRNSISVELNKNYCDFGIERFKKKYMESIFGTVSLGMA